MSASALTARYAQTMEGLHLACIVVSRGGLIVITLIIPYGVFMRYVVNARRLGRSRRRCC